MKNVKYLLMLLFLPVFIYAQERDYSGEPGYVDFGDLTQFEKEDNITEVYLDEKLLQMVSKLSKEEDETATELFSGLKLIKVNVFDVDPSNEKNIQNRITELDKKLISKNWDRIVKTRQRGEFVNVYIKQDSNKKIAGLVVMVLEKKGEAVFINIVGNIDLEQLGQLGHKFNIPSLGDIDKK